MFILEMAYSLFFPAPQVTGACILGGDLDTMLSGTIIYT